MTCKLCGKALAYSGAIFCGAACCARHEGGERAAPPEPRGEPRDENSQCNRCGNETEGIEPLYYSPSGYLYCSLACLAERSEMERDAPAPAAVLPVAPAVTCMCHPPDEYNLPVSHCPMHPLGDGQGDTRRHTPAAPVPVAPPEDLGETTMLGATSLGGYRIYAWMGRWSWQYIETHDGCMTHADAVAAVIKHRGTPTRGAAPEP